LDCIALHDGGGGDVVAMLLMNMYLIDMNAPLSPLLSSRVFPVIVLQLSFDLISFDFLAC
jgi:hypothetical protein